MNTLAACLQLMRLHQPIGIFLLLWPCWWSIGLASQDITQSLLLFVLFFLGAVVMRSSGCIINDIWDREIDVQVRRTRNRPLASGKLSLKQALSVLVLLLALGLGILLVQNSLTVALGLIFAALMVVYPVMKRYISIPQIFLGITFNAGALMGWSAVTDELTLSAWLLYATCFFWTIGYDTIYAHQDKKDDAKLDIKSSALVFGKHSRLFVALCYLCMVGLLFGYGISQGETWLFYLGVGLALLHLLWQVGSVNFDCSVDCMKKFRSNAVLGGIVFLGVVLSRLVG